MATSPPYAPQYGGGTSVSPPYPSHTPLPPKRRTTEHGPTPKRRKPSTTSTHSSHPLRQTSFPPDGLNPDGRAYSADARSPSVDATSMVSGSVVSKPPKKRGRKGKGGADEGSLVGGSTAMSMVSGGRQREGTRGVSPEDDDDEVGTLDVALVSRTNEEKEKEKYYRALLVGALDPDQYARYERWRSSKLADAVVRRLVNQTLSQSVPSNVVMAVKSVTKVFAGELIERARKIQTQWLAASAESQIDDPEARGAAPVDTSKDVQLWEANKKEERRGPLTPEHLREALRRYKSERAGGLVGLMGLDRGQHSTGADRFGLKARGRRLLG
ncbi:hypothetical protein VE00_02770 [Pseudogymnoascus sp. WSF 3629]|nr:hypothetical protein VE00_02770 [Pseudogymnoascus sp. WSF 3629]